METKKWAMVIIGPPGSGKGTQAELLAEKFGLIHFETSKVIEEKLNNADPSDEVLMREKELRASGELNTPELVREWTLEKVRELGEKGIGFVMSGSPRTLFEAEGEIPAFEELYGKENVKAIHLNLSKEESIKRNSARRICQANRHTIPNFPIFKDITTCPKDGSPLLKRDLDTPETISVRYEVYLRRTQPIFSYLSDRGYSTIEIEGEQDIDKVFDDILTGLGEK
jgi:adenylate kinase